MATLPPPPTSDVTGSFGWLEWFRQLRTYITQVGSVPWNIINFAGSKISDIADTNHQTLDSLQGGVAGQYYHVTLAQHTDLTAGFTGTGSIARGTGPTFSAPVLGTPASGTLTNCGGLPPSGLTSAAFGTAVSGTTIQATNSAGYKSSDGSTGYTGTVTTASLVGKTITIKDGIITGFA